MHALPNQSSDSLEARLRKDAEAGELSRCFADAMAAYGPELLGFMNAMLRHEEEARELYAQLCEDLWKALPDFEWRASFRTWAYCAARNAVHRHRAKASQKRLRPLTSRTIDSFAHRERTETAPHLRTENKDRIARLRAELAPLDQMLLILRIDRDLAWDEIAEITSGEALAPDARARAAAAMRKRFERVKERLRALARDEGLIPEEP